MRKPSSSVALSVHARSIRTPLNAVACRSVGAVGRGNVVALASFEDADGPALYA